jgi:hypothetical protein
MAAMALMRAGSRIEAMPSCPRRLGERVAIRNDPLDNENHALALLEPHAPARVAPSDPLPR